MTKESQEDKTHLTRKEKLAKVTLERFEEMGKGLHFYDDFRKTSKWMQFADKLYLSHLSGESFLEIGCGQGHLMEKFAQKFPKAIVDACTYNGNRYIIPVTQHYVTMFYNSKIFG